MKKTNIKAVLAVFSVIALAVLCHGISYNISTAFVARILDFTRTFLYIGLFSVWGFSISKRVVQKQAKALLISVAALEVFWLVMRELKYRFVSSPDLLRHLWYEYYVPVLLIPLLALFVSMLLSKPEGYRLPRKAFPFAVPTLALIVLVLTNDFHQLAFRFPENASVWTEREYSYGIVYFSAVVWAVLCSLISFVIMLSKSRLEKNRKAFPLPLIPILAAVIYIILYILRVGFVLRMLGDVAVFFCLVFTGYFESCIQSGLIQSNTRYFNLFSSIEEVSISITDDEYNQKYASKKAEKISVSNMKKAEGAPIILDNKKRLHNMKIAGGHAIWSEDISEILALSQALTETKEELEERNALLNIEYEKEKEHKTTLEQNRLYDLLQAKTQPQLNKINALMQQYRQTENFEKKQIILGKIVVLGTYIKRRKDFVLSMEYASEFPELMLSSALGESFRALGALDIKGSYLVCTNRELICAKTLSLAYDLFEDIVETLLDKANYINFQLCEIGSALRLSIITDCAQADASLLEKYPKMRLENEGFLHFLLELEGGEEQ